MPMVKDEKLKERNFIIVRETYLTLRQMILKKLNSS